MEKCSRENGHVPVLPSGWIAEQRKNYAIFRRYDRFHNGQMYLISIVDHPPFNSDPL